MAKYVKIIIYIGAVVFAFGAGLWTGCGTNGNIKAELNRSLEINTEAKRELSSVLSDLGTAKENNRKLESIIDNLESENQRSQENYIKLESNYNQLRSAIIEGAGDAGRTEKLIIECIEILQAEDHN